MTSIPNSILPRVPRDISELFRRDLTSLLVTSRAVIRSLEALRPECAFSNEVTTQIDDLIGASAQGEEQMRAPLGRAGVVLAPAIEADPGVPVMSYFTRLPAGVSAAMLAAEVIVNLRLLAQHLELKARLAAEEALLVGQKAVSQALLRWARAWSQCGDGRRASTTRARVQASAPESGEPVAAPSS
ncbi:MAG TPA: hypothetical protein VGM73_14945 [Candidatus Didemnitutus sp.]|jgi:hypothetical protein